MARECPAFAPRNKIYKNVEDSKLVLKYGITFEDFKAMLKQQNFQCAICGIHQAELIYRMAVDHDHGTGKVRGLLCRPCNHALGLLKDDSGNPARAPAYWEAKKGGRSPPSYDGKQKVVTSTPIPLLVGRSRVTFIVLPQP